MRLIIFEGIMGSGKSRATLHFAKQLGATAVHETTDPHPVRGADGLEHWFQPWLDVSTQQLAARALAKWRAFVRAQQGSDAVPALDGQLFHGDLTHLFLMEASEAEIEAYCRELLKVMRPLDPYLVYFRQKDVAKAIEKICIERGPDWAKCQTDWKLQTPYSVRRKLGGQAGLARLYEDYRRLTDRLYDKLDIPKIAIENTAGNWDDYYRRIEANL